MDVDINAIEACTVIPEYMTAEEISHAMQHYDHLNALMMYVIHGWPSTGVEVKEDVQPYWPFRDNKVVIDRITMKGKRNMIPVFLHKWALQQLHVNHMILEKIRISAHNSICWVNINHDIEDAVKNCPVLIYRWHNLRIRWPIMKYQERCGELLVQTFSP